MNELLIARRKGNILGNGPMSIGRFAVMALITAVLVGIFWAAKNKFPNVSDETKKNIIVGAVIVLVLIAIAVRNTMP